MRVIVLTTFSLIAFAANSLLCRMALGQGQIDPVTFTSLRLASGALALLPLSYFFGESRDSQPQKGSWLSGFILFIYALVFSLAYITLETGMGALIMFGAVQVSMIATALKRGERLAPKQWLGCSIAIAGLIYLLSPGLSAPSPTGALLMCASGVAWGLYSSRGKGVSAPINMTAGNFARATLMTLAASLIASSKIHASSNGIILALISGIVTSGIGYVIWYKALPHLKTSQASIVQLTVPIIAAFAGVGFLNERITIRLLMSSILILGGVAWAVTHVEKKTAPHTR